MLAPQNNNGQNEVKIIDTNFISYKYKRVKEFRAIDIMNAVIPSVVAIEFLNNQSALSMKANYYIPNISSQLVGSERMEFLTRRDHPFNKNRSDSISFDFNEDFESFKLYNNFSISNVINENMKELYKASVKFLSKEKRKELVKKYNFIIASRLNCIPIVDSDMGVAYDLLEKAVQDKIVNLKNNFKNSWNDILILSKAISSNGVLMTADKELSKLNKFAAEVYNGKIHDVNKVIEVSFKSQEVKRKSTVAESKGYINKGWDYK